VTIVKDGLVLQDRHPIVKPIPEQKKRHKTSHPKENTNGWKSLLTLVGLIHTMSRGDLSDAFTHEFSLMRPCQL